MTKRLLILAAISVLVTSCGGHGEPGGPSPAALEAYCGSDYAEVERRIDALLRELTLQEKARLMHGAALAPSETGYLASRLEARGIPGLHMVDGPRGVTPATGLQATAFPVGMARGATWDPGLERRVGRAMGLETRAAGADVLLAPTISVLRHPRWGRAQETYGEDPVHIGAMAVPFVEGVQENVLATAKHFVANSIEDTRFEVDVTVDERTLREVYLPAFRRLVQDAHVASVMSAYNSVNGSFCSENDHLLREVLDGEWQFSGYVVSDWFAGTHDTVAAARAGLDIEMPSANIYGGPLVAAVQAGELSSDDLDRAVRRILRAQFCFGLDTNAATRDPSAVATTAHTELAREVARRSMVLLKNDGVLPIDRGATTNVVVLGNLADEANIGDTGSSNVEPPYVVTALQGLVAGANGMVTITHIASARLSAAEQTMVADADVAVVVTGLTAADEGEGLIAAGDRTGLGLPAAQEALIAQVEATGTPTVVVLEGGSAITMGSWLGNVGALLMAWYPGLEGGNALADIVYGDFAPSGRLPLSFPVAEADLPGFDNVSTSVTYGPLHGYRYLQHEATAPLFPFGFGLTYTDFTLANLRLSSMAATPDDTLTVQVDVENTGSVDALETVQLYVGAVTSAIALAPRKLQAFSQVAVAAGTTETVSLELPIAQLAYYDVATMTWVVEPTDYRVEVGSSSEDLPLSATLTVAP